MIAPILKYPGAKWRLAPWLHTYAPRARTVVEPYCGSAAFSLTLPYAPRQLVVNDTAGDIPALFRAIRDHETELCRAIALTPWSRSEYLEVTQRDSTIVRTGDVVEDARRYLILTWQQHGTKLSRRGGWRNQGANGRASTYELWSQLPDRLSAVATVLRAAEIECLPALTIIGRYSTPDALLYLDPPYLLTTRKNERLYQHEMTEADHAALLEAADAHPGPVLLSGYASALYDDRLPHWQRLTLRARVESGQSRIEVLWINPAAAQCLITQSHQQETMTWL
jgi:DNA adenine methylase